MKNIIVVALLIGLTACDFTNYQKSSDSYTLPKELSDCSMIAMSAPDSGRIFVVRCPNSTVSTDQPNGKHRQTIITIDGVEYERKEK